MKAKNTSAAQVFDEAKLHSLRELDGGGNGFVIELATIFLAEAPGVFAGVESAVQAKDAAQLRQYAHKLKGMCLNMGVKTLTQHCEQLEKLGISGRVDGATELVGAYKRDYPDVVAFLKRL
jgi:HPt (histidine-containing phosphotransfer) domain-containing protein